MWLKALGFEAKWDIKEFSRVLAMKVNRGRDEIEGIISQCEEVLKGGVVGKTTALSLAKELQRLRKELSDAGIH